MAAISPLRYPGGKSRLSPFFRHILERKNIVGGCYVEPYAGGSGLALDLLINECVDYVYINDKDSAVYSFWSCCMEHTEDLCRNIIDSHVNMDTWRSCKDLISDQVTCSKLDKAFSLFFLNRVNRSGIVSGGAIGGVSQSGKWKMDARYNKKELVRRIKRIALYKDRIYLSNEDAIFFLQHAAKDFPASHLIYCDPPYYQTGRRLYMNYYADKDHEDIAKYLQKNPSLNWIVSYNVAPLITRLYKNVKGFRYRLRYSAHTSSYGQECMFFSPTFSHSDIAESWKQMPSTAR